MTTAPVRAQAEEQLQARELLALSFVAKDFMKYQQKNEYKEYVKLSGIRK